jgi:4-amino-4-deoxy-L-arabinose transferase-like glycosyltransferase
VNNQNKHSVSIRLSIGFALLALILTILILCSVPPVSRDALTHHLAVPKIWIEKGLFKELPAIPFSYYPMNLDLLYLVPLYFGNDIFPKYIHFAFALCTAFLVYTYLKPRIGTSYALLGSLFFLSIPIIVKLSTTVYVDLGLIFFSTASLLGLIKWSETDFRPKSLIMSALWCGLALGTKYNGLIVFFLLSCFVPFIYLRRADDDELRKSVTDQFRALGWGLVFVIISLLVYSPWMVRNTVMTGNPVYPLYNRFFVKAAGEGVKTGGLQNISTDEKEKPGKKGPGLKHFALRKMVYGESLGQIFLIPLRIFFEGQDDNPKYFDGKLTPFLLILPLLLLFPDNKKDARRRFEVKVFSLFAVAYLMFVFFRVDMRIRWVGPMIPPLVILSMFGFARLVRMALKQHGNLKAIVLKSVAIGAVAGMLLFNAAYLQALYQKNEPLGYLAGKIDRDSYITHFRPEYEVIRHINRELPDNAVILCLFIGNRIYYFDRDVRLDMALFQRSVIGSDSIDQMGDFLNRSGLTHIFLRYDLSDSWIKNNLDREKQNLVKLFFQKNAKQIKSFGGYGLFELALGGHACSSNRHLNNL